MRNHETRNIQIVAHIVLMISAILCLVPFILLIISSFSSETLIIKNGYSFFPQAFSLEAYSYLVNQWSMIGRSYLVTLFVTAVGTVLGLFITALLAYPLSRKDLPGRGILSFILFFTMLFNGGLVPSYIMWTQYFHIKNTLCALIIPNLLMNAFFVILIRTYYQTNIPFEMIEASQIDGASEFTTFIKIVFPLSKPILATVGLFIGLNYWNDWNNGLIYLTDEKLFSIQTLLNQMINNIQFLQTNSGAASQGNSGVINALPTTTIRMAIAVIGVLPILIIYPIVQKNFVKGIVIGSVKG